MGYFLFNFIFISDKLFPDLLHQQIPVLLNSTPHLFDLFLHPPAIFLSLPVPKSNSLPQSLNPFIVSVDGKHLSLGDDPVPHLDHLPQPHIFQQNIAVFIFEPLVSDGFDLRMCTFGDQQQFYNNSGLEKFGLDIFPIPVLTILTLYFALVLIVSQHLPVDQFLVFFLKFKELLLQLLYFQLEKDLVFAERCGCGEVLLAELAGRTLVGSVFGRSEGGLRSLLYVFTVDCELADKSALHLI